MMDAEELVLKQNSGSGLDNIGNRIDIFHVAATTSRNDVRTCSVYCQGEVPNFVVGGRPMDKQHVTTIGSAAQAPAITNRYRLIHVG